MLSPACEVCDGSRYLHDTSPFDPLPAPFPPVISNQILRDWRESAFSCSVNFPMLKEWDSLRLWCRLWCEKDVVGELESGIWVALERDEVHDEVILDGEDGVGGQIWVVGWEDLGGDGDVVVVGDLMRELA